MRSNKVFKNSAVALFQNCFTLVLSFVSRTVFINVLGVQLLGVNGLFSDIFNMLSLMELGIGSAITYYLYSPIANNNKSKITQILNLYKKLYNRIGIAILIVGILIVPLLPHVIKDFHSISNIEVIYLLMLSNVVASYFYAYKRALLEADQKAYLNSLNILKVNVIKNVLNIVFLLLVGNYYIYLIVNILCTLYSNISISRKIDKLYPYILNEEEDLSKEETKSIFSRARALLYHKIGTVVVFGTDNILFSTVANFKFIGMYSNYIMIINMVSTPLNQIFNALTASVGNISALEDDETSKNIFDRVFFANFWIMCFCSISLYVLLNPFIEIWLGNEYLLEMEFVFLLVLNFFITGIRNSANYFCLARGLFWNTRFKPIVEAVLNIVFSLLFIYLFGPIGIVLGTTVSSILTSVWIEPYVLYKNWFKVSSKKYFFKLLIYVCITSFIGGFTYHLCEIIYLHNIYLNFILKIFFVVIISNVSIVFLFRKTSEFKYIYLKLLNILKSLKRK